MLAVFAHDIRTALTGILALGELLASSNLGERERRWAAGIKVSAEHLAALTTLVIDAAKAEAGAITLQQEIFRPRRLIDELRETLSARAQAKDLRVAVTVADDMPELVLGDPVRLRAALENLIDNAVKFTAQGLVRLEARASRAPRGRMKITFVVSDSGIGLKPTEIKRLFRPFAQANAEIARRYGGAGLGLAVVKVLAKAMGGDLTVVSTPGRGSSFRFSAVLPIARADAAAIAPARQTSAPVRRLNVLCAEDNPYGRVILNTILTELGHRADFAGSGEEAVAAVPRGYDVVLMDVTLPGIDGLEATRRIRALGGRVGGTPIIGVTGRTADRRRNGRTDSGHEFLFAQAAEPERIERGDRGGGSSFWGAANGPATSGRTRWRQSGMTKEKLFRRVCCRRVRRAFDDAHQIAHDAVELEILRRVDLGDAGAFERAGVLRRDNAADHDRHIVEAGLLHARDHVADQRHVRARQDRQADHVHVLFRRRRDDRLGGQTDAVIDHLHAGVAGAGGDLLGAVGMAVEARLADQKFQPPAELFRHPVDLGADVVEAFGVVAHGGADAGRRAVFAERGAQRKAPFAGGDAGFGAVDRGRHDVVAALCRAA